MANFISPKTRTTPNTMSSPEYSKSDHSPHEDRARLDAKIEKWKKNKPRNAILFILLGLAGLVIPVIPGLLFLAFGAWLLFPEQTETVWSKIKRKLKKE